MPTPAVISLVKPRSRHLAVRPSLPQMSPGVQSPPWGIERIRFGRVRANSEVAHIRVTRCGRALENRARSRCAGRRIPPFTSSESDLVPLESLLEVLPGERRQDFIALRHAIHRHPLRRAYQRLQIRRRNAL